MCTWGPNIYYSLAKNYIVGYKLVNNIIICQYLVIRTNVVPILDVIELLCPTSRVLLFLVLGKRSFTLYDWVSKDNCLSNSSIKLTLIHDDIFTL
jgi:hypothetical protein